MKTFSEILSIILSIAGVVLLSAIAGIITSIFWFDQASIYVMGAVGLFGMIGVITHSLRAVQSPQETTLT